MIETQRGLSIRKIAEFAAQGAFTPSALNHARIALRRAKGLKEATVGSGQSLLIPLAEAFEVLLVRQLTDTRVASLDRAAIIVSKFREARIGHMGRAMSQYFDEAFGPTAGFKFSSYPFNSILKIYGREFGQHKDHVAELTYYNPWNLVLLARNPQLPTPDLDLMVAAPFRVTQLDGRTMGEVREIYPLYYPDSLTRETHMLEGRFNGAAAALDLHLMFGPVNRLYSAAVPLKPNK